jgi:hypothetical protein
LILRGDQTTGWLAPGSSAPADAARRPTRPGTRPPGEGPSHSLATRGYARSDWSRIGPANNGVRTGSPAAGQRVRAPDRGRRAVVDRSAIQARGVAGTTLRAWPSLDATDAAEQRAREPTPGADAHVTQRCHAGGNCANSATVCRPVNSRFRRGYGPVGWQEAPASARAQNRQKAPNCTLHTLQKRELTEDLWVDGASWPRSPAPLTIIES